MCHAASRACHPHGHHTPASGGSSVLASGSLGHRLAEQVRAPRDEGVRQLQNSGSSPRRCVDGGVAEIGSATVFFGGGWPTAIIGGQGVP
jgi:hypothetical protein